MSYISKYIKPLMFFALAGTFTACVDENLAGISNQEEVNISEKIVNTPAGAVEGELLVFLSESSAGNSERVYPTQMDVKSFEPIFKATDMNREFLKKHKLDRWYKVEFNGMATDCAARAFAQMGEVSLVQYNTIASYGTVTRSDAGIASTISSDSDFPFNDPRREEQWHYINTGDKKIASAAVEGADIGVKDVWKNLTAGDSEIIVAILDGPVKHTHEDLKDNMWKNVFEVPGNNIDDDRNGYVDDIHGWNFERDTCKLTWDLKGDTSHGTHVAGVVGAVNNNNKGVCGVAGGSGNGDGVRLMSCQIMEEGISTSTYSGAQAFVYAADNGAHIAQCSFGYQNSAFKSDYEYYQSYGLEYFAIQYFLDKERWAKMEEDLNARLADKGLPTRTKIIDGPLVIFAAGNDGLDCASYPGALMDCICVTGTGPDGLPAYYTNFGPGCNIAAPGGDYYLNPETGRSQILSTTVNEAGHGDYSYMGGTSMACPHVSGVAALGLAYAKKLGKTFTREEFTALLLSSVNDIDSRLNTGYKYIGIDPATGADLDPRPYSTYQYNMGTGSIDAWRFMMNLEGTPSLFVRVGKDGTYNIDQFFGEASEYLTYASVEIDRETMASLGITLKPKIKNGMLSINPGKSGSGKIKITAIAGGNNVAGSITGDMTGNGDIVTIPGSSGMGGMYITREISIISRGSASDNGGWL